MIRSEDVTFQSHGDRLIGTIDYNEAGDKPTVLWLHGSNPGGSRRTTLTTRFAEAGHSAFRFDLSGHGDSEGAQDLPITRFVDDAVTALQFMDREKPLTLIGSSMGGHIALELLNHARVENLVLFCPAAYLPEACQLPFGFNRCMKTEPDAPVFAALRNYTGNLLHIIGEHDAVIPVHVTALYKKFSERAKKREFIVVPEVEHAFTSWFEQYPEKKRALFQTIVDFASKTA